MLLLWNCIWHAWGKPSKFFSPAAGYKVESFSLMLAINLRILLKIVKLSKLICMRRAAYTSGHYYIFSWKLIAAPYKKSEKCLLPVVGHHLLLLWNCFWHAWNKPSKLFLPAAGYIVESFSLMLAINLRILLKIVKLSKLKYACRGLHMVCITTYFVEIWLLHLT